MVLVATQVKRRRGTTAENDAFTGAEGEITVDTEKHELRVHDGMTQGGFKVGSGTGALIIGQILEVVGTADYTPVGCLLADGAEYTKAQFPNLWADFLTGTPKLQTCTYTEYANQIAEYGFCNKFAVDTTNETFKVPTRNKYRKLVKKIVNGTTWANLYDDGWCEQGGYVSTTADAYLITMPIEMANANYIINVSTKSSSVSAPQDNNQAYRNTAFIAGNAFYNQTTTGFGVRSANWLSFVGKCWQVSGYAPIPDSTANITREFVVVANGTLNEEQMDWSAWASSLAGRATTDMNNITSTGKETVVGWGLPDYSAGISINNNTDYTCPTDGFLIATGYSSNASASDMLLNGSVIIRGIYNTAQYTYTPFILPVRKNDVVRVQFTGASVGQGIIFYPYKGV